VEGICRVLFKRGILFLAWRDRRNKRKSVANSDLRTQIRIFDFTNMAQ